MIEVATLAEAIAVKQSNDGRPVIAIESGSPCRVYFQGDQLPAHMVVVAQTPQQIVTNLREAAKALIVAEQAEDKRFKAFVLVTLDELNLHASKINAVMTAIDGAATFAAMKTAISAIQDYPPRTVEQLRTAMRNKIDAGEAD